MRYISRNERPIYIEISIDSKGFVMKISYRLNIDRSQSNVYVFILGDVSMDPIEIVEQ